MGGGGASPPIVWQKCKKNGHLKFHVKVPVHVAKQPCKSACTCSEAAFIEQIRLAYIQLRGGGGGGGIKLIRPSMAH